MQYDNTYRNLETLRKIKIPGHDDWEVDLVHVVTSSAVRGWIASREFLNYRVKLTLPDKRVVLAAKSVDELKDTPLKVFSGRATTISILNVLITDVVKAKNYPSGVICEPIEDGKATRLIEVVCTDLRFFVVGLGYKFLSEEVFLGG